MNTSTTFFNKKIAGLEEKRVQINKQIEAMKKDRNHYHNHHIASKKYYGLLVKKFENALEKARLEAIQNDSEWSFRNHIKVVYLHKIDQFSQFQHHAPEVLR